MGGAPFCREFHLPVILMKDLMLDWYPQGPPIFYHLNLPWKDALPIGWNLQSFGAIQVANQRSHVSIIPQIAPAPSLKEGHGINPRIISNIVSSRLQPFE
jgi:hypothetical protein